MCKATDETTKYPPQGRRQRDRVTKNAVSSLSKSIPSTFIPNNLITRLLLAAVFVPLQKAVSRVVRSGRSETVRNPQVDRATSEPPFLSFEENGPTYVSSVTFGLRRPMTCPAA